MTVFFIKKLELRKSQKRTSINKLKTVKKPSPKEKSTNNSELEKSYTKPAANRLVSQKESEQSLAGHYTALL